MIPNTYTAGKDYPYLLSGEDNLMLFRMRQNERRRRNDWPMGPEQKRKIEREARQMRGDFEFADDACPYPMRSFEADVFVKEFENL